MAQNTQQDSILHDKLYFPYNRILSSHDDTPRIVEGINTYITQGGKLSRRPATLELPIGTEFGRIDRLFLYETLNGRIYLLASIYDPIGAKWSMFYNRPSASTNWVQIGTLRSCDASAVPQEVSIARGLAYIRNVPTNPSSDPYGTAVFDGSGTPTLSIWGVPVPSTPAAIVGGVGLLSADITDIDTEIILTADFSPSIEDVPFTIVVDNEVMLVTANNLAGSLIVERGYAGTFAAYHSANTPVYGRIFGASDHYNQINSGWRYTYAYVSTTGQISNIAPPQTNPDLNPSFTGPFADSCPKITVYGHSDTTNIPYINIYRTTDGGGQFYFLEQISNTGSGAITYIDDSLASGATSSTYNDPIPDEVLNLEALGPTLTSNSPPPTVLAPDLVGVDAPIEGTPIAYFAGRHWYGLRNYLFYSGNEEITSGVPEECFPSGTLFENSFKFQHPLVNVKASTSALYVSTVHDTYVITGTTRDSFAVRPLYKNLGSPYNQPLSITTYGDKVVVLTNDYRIAILEGDSEPRIISDPLYTDLVDAINLGGEVEITYFGDLEKEWIVVAVHNQADTSKSRQFIYDVKLSKKAERDFWFTPWSIPSVVCFSGRIYEDSSQRRLCFFSYNNTAQTGALVRIDPTARTNTDAVVNNSGTVTQNGIDYYVMFHQHVVPAGNHVNLLRLPNLTVVVNQLTLERILYPGDTDPKVYYYTDDLWFDPKSTVEAFDPARRELSTGYKTLVYPIEESCFRFTFRIQANSSTRPFDLLGYVITFNPDNGA